MPLSQMDFASLLIVGAVVSVIVQLVKQYFISNAARIGIVIAISLIAGVIYRVLFNSVYWMDFLGILASAGAVYSYLISQFEKTGITTINPVD